VEVASGMECKKLNQEHAGNTHTYKDAPIDSLWVCLFFKKEFEPKEEMHTVGAAREPHVTPVVGTYNLAAVISKFGATP
jgi:hypothetical protein